MNETITSNDNGTVVYSYESGSIRYTYTFQTAMDFEIYSRTGRNTWTDRRHERIG
jgi:hypothetical protein